ncbi:MAG TPA: hypothetical protein PKJ64_14815 [bacterium]|nr:hypothetical protein [bacterium]
MRQRLTQLGIIVSVFVLFLSGFDALDQQRYAMASLYLLCVALYIAVWRISLHVVMQKQVWLTWVGTFVILIAAMDYFSQGKKYLPYAYILAAVINTIPVFFKRRSAKS